MTLMRPIKAKRNNLVSELFEDTRKRMLLKQSSSTCMFTQPARKHSAHLKKSKLYFKQCHDAYIPSDYATAACMETVAIRREYEQKAIHGKATPSPMTSSMLPTDSGTDSKQEENTHTAVAVTTLRNKNAEIIISPLFISETKVSCSANNCDFTLSAPKASLRHKDKQQLRLCEKLPISLFPSQSSAASALPTSSSSKSSASSSPLPVMRSKAICGLFITLAVLSICSNNVLAATLMTQSITVGFQSSPQVVQPSALQATSLKTENNSLPDVIKDGQSIHNYQIQTTSSLLLSNSSSTYVRNLRRQGEPPEVQAINPMVNKPSHAILPLKQKRQQRNHQLPQYLTSTQETAFSPNARSLDATQNRSLPGLTIVNGRLTVPMDMDMPLHPQSSSQQEHGIGSTRGGSSDAALIDANEMLAIPKRPSMPVFDFGMARNITARTGHMEAVIKCRVDRLNDKSVSWIRKRDLHILSVGKTTYTSDKRFQVTESKDSREWTLHVKSPQARDSGIYECQVNTEPKMSMAFQLNIIEISPDAKAVIPGAADLYIKVGSAIILTCLVHQPSLKDIGPIHWYRGEYLITPFNANDGTAIKQQNFGVTAALTSKSNTYRRDNANAYDSSTNARDEDDEEEDEEQMSQVNANELTKDFTQRIAIEEQLCDAIKARLRIANAQKSDSGNYTCQPTTASSASVMVHVINDENPAAMQKS